MKLLKRDQILQAADVICKCADSFHIDRWTRLNRGDLVSGEALPWVFTLADKEVRAAYEIATILKGIANGKEI